MRLLRSSLNLGLVFIPEEKEEANTCIILQFPSRKIHDQHREIKSNYTQPPSVKVSFHGDALYRHTSSVQERNFLGN